MALILNLYLIFAFELERVSRQARHDIHFFDWPNVLGKK